MSYGKSSFIITVHTISIRVHFSVSIIDTPATFGPGIPTKHGWPLQSPYRVLAMTPIIPKIRTVFFIFGSNNRAHAK